ATTNQVTDAVRDQGQGGEHIRRAMIRMRQVTADVASAAAELAQGARSVGHAIVEMNRITNEGAAVVRSQEQGIRKIAHASSTMKRTTSEVSNATVAQRKDGALVELAAQSITRVARANLMSIEEIAASADRVAKHSNALSLRIRVFRVE